MTEPKYPDVKVQLSGEDGNALAVIGAVKRGLRAAGVGVGELADFQKEALSGDYDHVLQTAMKWLTSNPMRVHFLPIYSRQLAALARHPTRRVGRVRDWHFPTARNSRIPIVVNNPPVHFHFIH